MAPMDYPDMAGAEQAEQAEPIANQDPELKGGVGDTFLKCGKCMACYAIDIEV